MSIKRQIYQYLFKSGIRPWLIIIQLLVGFVSSTVGLGMVEASERLISTAKNLTPSDTIVVTPKNPTQINQSLTSEKLQTTYNIIQNDKNIKGAGTFYEESIHFNELIDVSELKAMEDRQQNIGGNVHIGFVDMNFLKMYPFHVDSGRTLTQEDALAQDHTGTIPILIGNQLAKYAPIGTILTGGLPDDRSMSIVSRKFLVVGILPKNFSFWTEGSGDLNSMIKQSDWMAISPMPNEFNFGDHLKTRLSENLLVQVKNTSDLSLVRQQIEKNFLEINLPVKTSTLNDAIDYYMKSKKTIILSIILFAALLLSLASFGLLGVILISIVRRQREFGIRFALGATPKSLAILVAYETISLILVSAVIGLLIAVGIGLLFPAEKIFVVGPMTCLITISIILVVTLISILLPTIRIIRMNPMQLIRGES